MISSAAITDYVCKYSTPMYLYDGDNIISTYRSINSMLHESATIYLSLKANNNISIANIFNELGSGVEVASYGELMLALTAGFTTDRIIYSGPGKTVEELTAAINQDINCIMVESIDELKIINSISETLNKVTTIGIRVNPDKNIINSTIKMGGAPRQFGIDEEKLNDVFGIINSLKHIKFLGIHVYSGTQILSEENIVSSFKNTLEIARNIHLKYGLICEVIDLGGGFGIPYFTHEKPLDQNLLFCQINETLIEYLKVYPNTKFIIESGRYLLAESGFYISKILYKKESKGEFFLITDGGLNHHTASTFRGRGMRNNYPIEILDSNFPSEEETVNVVGPLCTPEDCLAKSISLSVARPGNHLIIKKSGAYGLSYSANHFLGHATPVEVLIINGVDHIIRRRGTYHDLLNNQLLVTNLVK